MWGWDKKIHPENHRLASRALPSDDKPWSRETDFLSHLHTNNGLFFLLTTKYRFLDWKKVKKASRKSWIRWDATWWRHFNITITSLIDMRPVCRCSVFYLSLGLVRVCKIEISHMGKNNGNPDLVGEKSFFNWKKGPLPQSAEKNHPFSHLNTHYKKNVQIQKVSSGLRGHGTRSRN